MASRGWGWAGPVSRFLETEPSAIVRALRDWSDHLPPGGSSANQVSAWRASIQILQESLRKCEENGSPVGTWSVILEYELPLEGGRRPDAIVLVGGSIAVLEFKTGSTPSPAAVDQVAAYARDLAEGHEASHGRPVVPILVLVGASYPAFDSEGTVIASPSDLWFYLAESLSPGSIDLESWLNSPYVPLPTLVTAAKRLFAREPLPHVKRAESAGIPQAVELIGRILRDTRRRGSRSLVLVSGVPGSGKTLVGLRLVHEHSNSEMRGLFLSGNGPLVAVLQDALQSRVFVRDLHAFIRTYGLGDRTPKEKFLVFDEAQRAWDRPYMSWKRGAEKSEPELLVEIGDRIPEWAVLIGLIGEGQEIYLGEEGGLTQWADAVKRSEISSEWTVFCGPEMANSFEGLRVEIHRQLDLTVSLRSRRAEHLHEWVRLLLEGSLDLAKPVADRIWSAAYPLYITRELERAKRYARARYAEEPDKRYGILLSSSGRIARQYGFDVGLYTMQRLRIGRWFNAAPDDPLSCCALTQPITEFQSQGLELDLPIVLWGKDLAWSPKGWIRQPKRWRIPARDPERLLTNAYRVLLTRGRDGLIVVVPGSPEFDFTEEALHSAGMRTLEEDIAPPTALGLAEGRPIS